MGKQVSGPRTTGNTDKKLILTPGEELLIWRRRKGWNQTEAAEYFDCSVFKLKMAEYGKAKDFSYVKVPKIELMDYEKCVIYRRRAKKTQTKIAKLVGLGREWLRLQELGQVPCDRLLQHWEGG